MEQAFFESLITKPLKVSSRSKTNWPSKSTGPKHNEMLRRWWDDGRGDLFSESFKCYPSPKTSGKCQTDPIDALPFVPAAKRCLVCDECRNRAGPRVDPLEGRASVWQTRLLVQSPELGDLWDGWETRFCHRRPCGLCTCLWIPSRVTSRRGLSWELNLQPPRLKLFKFGYKISEVFGRNRTAHSR